MTTAYWWRGDERVGSHVNLGDVLTPTLLRHFANLDVAWAPPETADIICSGSVLDVLPRFGWDGVVAGAGQLHEETITDLTFANVLGVRGLMTRERIQLHDGAVQPCIGDPGLLACELVTPDHQTTAIGVVPHWSDNDLYPRELTKAESRGYVTPILIDVTGEPLSVLAAIGSCEKIVTSALHGVIAADSFGIPRRAESFPNMTSDDAKHEGSWYKWKDYGSSIGQSIRFGTLQTAPKIRIDQMQRDLFEMFAILERLYV